MGGLTACARIYGQPERQQAFFLNAGCIDKSLGDYTPMINCPQADFTIFAHATGVCASPG